MKKLIKIVLPIVLCITMIMPIFLCGCANYGTFYSLKEAYSNGYITKEDVQLIAEIQNKGGSSSLANEISNEIKKSYAKQYASRNYNYKDVRIIKYVGEFNGCHAVIIKFKDEETFQAEGYEIVADTTITYNDGYRISIYEKLK